MERKSLDNSSEDIDLVYLLNSFLRGIAGIVSLIWKNVLVLLGIFLLMGVLGYCIRYVIPRFYVTKAVFVSRLLPANYCAYLVNGINDQVKSGDASALSAGLQIGMDKTPDIENVTAEAIEQDTTTIDKADPDAAGFVVTLTLRSMDNLDTIQNGLVRYLEGNGYAKSRNALKQKNLLALKNTLAERLVSLDSLKKALYNRYSSPGKDRGIIFGEPANPVAVYKEEMEYYKEQQVIDDKLSDPHSIQVLAPFVKLTKPNAPNVGRIFRYSLVGGLALALIATLIYGLNKERRLG